MRRSLICVPACMTGRNSDAPKAPSNCICYWIMTATCRVLP
jgi:hypothetical protein